jgi:hypothetical protein
MQDFPSALTFERYLKELIELEKTQIDRLNIQTFYLKHILKTEKRLYELLNRPTYLYIKWIGANTQMSTNNVTLNLTAPFGSNQAVPVELLANGQPFIIVPANIAWQVQNSAIATFVQNPDGSATFTPLSAGSTGVAVQDTVTGLSAQGVLTVVGSVTEPTSMSINWQVPGTDTVTDVAKKVSAKAVK